MSVGDIDVFEVNEAVATVPLAWAYEFGVDQTRLNPCGGAIALTLVHNLVRSGGRYGLRVMCESGGMANPTLIKRLQR